MPNMAALGSPPESNASRERFAQRIERSIASRLLILARRGRRHELVEGHDDVGAEQALDLDRPLGREHVPRAVEVANSTPSSLTLASSVRLITW
jgi:hypothetical protein